MKEKTIINLELNDKQFLILNFVFDQIGIQYWAVIY